MVDTSPPLQLRAYDLEGLSVIGGMVQDALFPAGDLRYLKEQGEFVALINRFRWEAAGEADGPYSRTHAGLRFDGVTQVQYKGLDWSNAERILSLLTIAYDAPQEGGAGEKAVALHFSDGAAVRLVVEDLRCMLADLGEPWPTQWKPGHAPE